MVSADLMFEPCNRFRLTAPGTSPSPPRFKMRLDRPPPGRVTDPASPWSRPPQRGPPPLVAGRLPAETTRTPLSSARVAAESSVCETLPDDRLGIEASGARCDPSTGRAARLAPGRDGFGPPAPAAVPGRASPMSDSATATTRPRRAVIAVAGRRMSPTRRLKPRRASGRPDASRAAAAPRCAGS